jgi:hypothetical protein
VDDPRSAAVVLVGHLADQFLDQVLQGHYPGSTAVLVQHDGQLQAQRPQFDQQRIQSNRLRDAQRLGHDRCHRHVVPALPGDRDRALQMHDPHHVVQVTIDHRESAVPGAASQRDHLGRCLVALQHQGAHPWSHHIGGGTAGETQRTGDQLGGLLIQRARRRRVPDQGSQFLRGTAGGQFLLRLHPDRTEQPVRGAVQQSDQRRHRGGEEPLWSRDHPGGGQRHRDRQILRDQLTDDHREGGRDSQRQHDRDAVLSCPLQPDRLQRGSKQCGERGLHQVPDHQGGDGDPDLGSGKLRGQGTDGSQDPDRPFVALLDRSFDSAAIEGDQSELRRHKDCGSEGE